MSFFGAIVRVPRHDGLDVIVERAGHFLPFVSGAPGILLPFVSRCLSLSPFVSLCLPTCLPLSPRVSHLSPIFSVIANCPPLSPVVSHCLPLSPATYRDKWVAGARGKGVAGARGKTVSFSHDSSSGGAVKGLSARSAR